MAYVKKPISPSNYTADLYLKTILHKSDFRKEEHFLGVVPSGEPVKRMHIYALGKYGQIGLISGYRFI